MDQIVDNGNSGANLTGTVAQGLERGQWLRPQRTKLASARHTLANKNVSNPEFESTTGGLGCYGTS